jgi:hypothetical protein
MVAFTRIRAEGLTTPAGRPRCDVCRRAVYNTQLCERVNGRLRHRQCWPAFEANLDRFLAISHTRPPLPVFWRACSRLVFEQQQLEEREFLMNSVARCSRETHARLTARSDETDAALALALAYRR